LTIVAGMAATIDAKPDLRRHGSLRLRKDRPKIFGRRSSATVGAGASSSDLEPACAGLFHMDASAIPPQQ